MENKKVVAKKTTAKKVANKESVTAVFGIIKMIMNVIKLRQAQGGKLKLDQWVLYGYIVASSLYGIYNNTTDETYDITPITNEMARQDSIINVQAKRITSQDSIISTKTGKIIVKDGELYIGMSEEEIESLNNNK